MHQSYTVPFTSVDSGHHQDTSEKIFRIYNLYSRRSVIPELRKFRYESADQILDHGGHRANSRLPEPLPKTAPAQAVDIDSLTQAIQRLKDSGYEITAANVSSLLGISVSEASQPIATITITLEQAARPLLISRKLATHLILPK